MRTATILARTVARRAVCVCVVAWLFGSTASQAQTYPGGVHGAVRDAHGAIPAAVVSLIDEETNASRTAMANDIGEFAFARVRPGTYAVTIGLPGFKTERRGGVRIDTQTNVFLDFTLEAGAVEAPNAAVAGESPIVEGTSPTDSASLDASFVQNLPTFGPRPF